MSEIIPKKLVIFGDGGIGELAQYYFTNDSPYEVVAFTIDGDRISDKTFNGLKVTPFETLAEDYPADDYAVFIALSYTKLNQVRQRKFEDAQSKGYQLPSYVASHLACADNVSIGANCFILENQTIQPFCAIGDNVTLWSGNHIGHHSTIADHTFISSHVVVSGNCRVGQRCFIGVNAAIRDGCNIGDDSFVGMNAAVTADMEPGSVALTASSEILPPDDRRARALKRSYFKL